VQIVCIRFITPEETNIQSVAPDHRGVIKSYKVWGRGKWKSRECLGFLMLRKYRI